MAAQGKIGPSRLHLSLDIFSLSLPCPRPPLSCVRERSRAWQAGAPSCYRILSPRKDQEQLHVWCSVRLRGWGLWGRGQEGFYARGTVINNPYPAPTTANPSSQTRAAQSPTPPCQSRQAVTAPSGSGQ